MRRRALLAAAGTIPTAIPGITLASEGATGPADEGATGPADEDASGDDADCGAEWVNHIEHSEQVHEELRAELQDTSWFRTSGLTTGDNTICGRTENAIRVYASDVEAAESYLGDERDGVQILIAEKTSAGGGEFRKPFSPEETDADAIVGEDDGGTTESPPSSTAGDTTKLAGLGALVSVGGIAYLRSRDSGNSE